jgi:hypothetical protein
MHIVYKVTYTPHIGTDRPKFYIGSKYRYSGNYYGSVSSKRKFDFTNDLTLREWWKKETKKNPHNFLFEILESHDNITPNELLDRELHYQMLLNCKDDDYFNQCYARRGWHSRKNTDETKNLKSKGTKAYWDSPEGIMKKQRLAERNSLTKPVEMKLKWENHDFRTAVTAKLQYPKSDTTRKKMSEARLRKSDPLEYKGNYYVGWEDLERSTGVTKHLYKKYYLNGYEPEVNIKNKHPIKIPLNRKDL